MRGYSWPVPHPARDVTARSRRAARPSGDDRETAILATAERLLAEQPLSGISVDDQARGAGISRPTFYFYFASKDAVLLTLLDRVVAEADAAMTRATTAFPRPAAAVGEASAGADVVPRGAWEQAISAYYDTFREHRGLTLAWAEARSTNTRCGSCGRRSSRGGCSGAPRRSRPSVPAVRHPRACRHATWPWR